MSIECYYCERDLRGPHDEDCPRYRPWCDDCDAPKEKCECPRARSLEAEGREDGPHE